MSWLHESVCVRIIQECAGYHPEGQTSKAEPPPYPCREIQTGILLRPSGRLLLFAYYRAKQSGKCAENFIPGIMPVSIIYMFEKVDIPHGNSQGL